MLKKYVHINHPHLNVLDYPDTAVTAVQEGSSTGRTAVQGGELAHSRLVGLQAGRLWSAASSNLRKMQSNNSFQAPSDLLDVDRVPNTAFYLDTVHVRYYH